jgi:undecaprenyl-diphosphatase
MRQRLRNLRLLHFIAARDYRLMQCVTAWSAPPWIRLWMTAATRAGDGWLWYLIGVSVAILGGEQRWAALAACTLAVTAGVALFMGLKRTFRRSRPSELGPHCWSDLLPPDQFSFPSGHTITAFAMAASLTPFYPGLLIPLSFCAASVAASRVVLGMHYLTDVIAGAGIGIILGRQAAMLFS